MRWSLVILVSLFMVSFAVAEIPGDCDDSTVSYFEFSNNVRDSYGSATGSGDIEGILKQLFSLLSDADGETKYYFTSNKSDLASSGIADTLVQQLSEQIESYDFDNAIRSVHDIAETMNISLC